MSYQLTFQAASSSNFTVGRGGKAITTIVIHHWGDPATHPTLEGVVRHFQNPAAGVSAHYVVEAGRVVQMVDLANTAWHAGNWPINQTSIGIECNPRASEADKQTIGELIRDLQARYGQLRIIGHKDASATACPGAYYPPASVLSPFIAAGGGVTLPPQATPSVAGEIEDLAHRVIAGEFGDGEVRKRNLGAKYQQVQARVNALLSGRPANQPGGGVSPAPDGDIEALADAVIRGDYGDGEDRKQRLGHLYAAVQERVNAKLGQGSAPAATPGPDLEAMADAAIRGEYGNGAERRNRLGHLFDAVQAIVNRKLGY